MISTLGKNVTTLSSPLNREEGTMEGVGSGHSSSPEAQSGVLQPCFCHSHTLLPNSSLFDMTNKQIKHTWVINIKGMLIL